MRVIWLSAGYHWDEPSGLSLFLRGFPRVGPQSLVCIMMPLYTAWTHRIVVPFTWQTSRTACVGMAFPGEGLPLDVVRVFKEVDGFGMLVQCGCGLCVLCVFLGGSFKQFQRQVVNKRPFRFAIQCHGFVMCVMVILIVWHFARFMSCGLWVGSVKCDMVQETMFVDTGQLVCRPFLVFLWVSTVMEACDDFAICDNFNVMLPTRGHSGLLYNVMVLLYVSWWCYKTFCQIYVMWCGMVGPFLFFLWVSTVVDSCDEFCNLWYEKACVGLWSRAKMGLVVEMHPALISVIWADWLVEVIWLLSVVQNVCILQLDCNLQNKTKTT